MSLTYAFLNRSKNVLFALLSAQRSGDTPDREYYDGWSRALNAAGVPHVGTRRIRHRSAADMANSGILAKVSLMLTADRTAGIFMRYVHTEGDPTRKATELVANWRGTIIGAQPSAEVMA